MAVFEFIYNESVRTREFKEASTWARVARWLVEDAAQPIDDTWTVAGRILGRDVNLALTLGETQSIIPSGAQLTHTKSIRRTSLRLAVQVDNAFGLLERGRLSGVQWPLWNQGVTVCPFNRRPLGLPAPIQDFDPKSDYIRATDNTLAYLVGVRLDGLVRVYNLACMARAADRAVRCHSTLELPPYSQTLVQFGGDYLGAFLAQLQRLQSRLEKEGPNHLFILPIINCAGDSISLSEEYGQAVQAWITAVQSQSAPLQFHDLLYETIYRNVHRTPKDEKRMAHELFTAICLSIIHCNVLPNERFNQTNSVSSVAAAVKRSFELASGVQQPSILYQPAVAHVTSWLKAMSSHETRTTAYMTRLSAFMQEIRAP